ncbi:DUF4082 domain-containing protein [Pedobacter caeni]|nr:DUF4082 domain-containing protein [Pedobacter caeni]
MMKKLISSLAGIPFSVLAQQFPEAPMCFYALRTWVALFLSNKDYRSIVAMDLKTHACQFNAEQPILITKVGYQAWKPGITYRIALWQVGRTKALSTCLVKPEHTSSVQYFTLKNPVAISPEQTYYISRTYIGGGPYHNMTDYIGWLSNKEGAPVYPLKQHVVTFSNGFFSNEHNPLLSDEISDISTRSLLPMIDFEYHY